MRNLKPYLLLLFVTAITGYLNLTISGYATGAERRTAQVPTSLPTAEQVLDRYTQAIGGKAAVSALTARIVKGSITAPAFEAKGTIAIFAKAPNKQLTEIVAPILGTLRTGYNGAIAWEEENGRVKEATDFVKREADFYFPIKIRELYPRIAIKGQERIGNADAYRLEAPRGGKPKRWYFDAQTGLLIRTEVRDAAGNLISSEDYEDYRVVDGIKMAFKTRSLEDGFEFVVNLEEVKHNVTIDDAKFEMPSAKPAATLTPAEQEAARQVKAETVREMTTTLAANEMQGRGMAQPGGEKAATYLAETFARLGLKPGGDGASYQQRMKVQIDTPLPQTSFRVGNKVFKFKKDFAIARPTSTAATRDATGNLVFVGYGVVSDELKRDDLARIDVRGKIVLVLKGKPANVDTAAWEKAANERVIFGRLVERGAAGFVVTYVGEAARFPVVAAFVSHRTVNLMEPLSTTTGVARWSIELLTDQFQMPPSVLISDSAAKRIFAARNLNFANLKQRAEAGEAVSLDLSLRASIRPRFKHGIGTSSNVIGVMEGSDPTVMNEAVVYTAHYDAYGKDTEGAIYAGASDNALGVGKLVALAEVFAKMAVKPRRSIIIMATTGEEYGDLGAAYWLEHATWPLEKVAANINFDGSILELWGKLGFVIDYGFMHSDLNEVIESVAAASGVEILPDPAPDEQFFFRSDQYAFVKRGIPALFLTGGPDDDPAALLSRARQWLTTHYHTPTDTVQSDWNWEGARMLAAIGLLTGLRVANQETLPAWRQDSPYNRPRGTTLPPPEKK